MACKSPWSSAQQNCNLMVRQSKPCISTSKPYLLACDTQWIRHKNVLMVIVLKLTNLSFRVNRNYTFFSESYAHCQCMIKILTILPFDTVINVFLIIVKSTPIAFSWGLHDLWIFTLGLVSVSYLDIISYYKNMFFLGSYDLCIRQFLLPKALILTNPHKLCYLLVTLIVYSLTSY